MKYDVCILQQSANTWVHFKKKCKILSWQRNELCLSFFFSFFAVHMYVFSMERRMMNVWMFSSQQWAFIIYHFFVGDKEIKGTCATWLLSRCDLFATQLHLEASRLRLLCLHLHLFIFKLYKHFYESLNNCYFLLFYEHISSCMAKKFWRKNCTEIVVRN